MGKRRKSYRLPEEKYDKLMELLEKKDLEFDEFLNQSIDLYLQGEIDPKTETDGWGNWMQE